MKVIFYEMPFVIYFRIDKWTERMLSKKISNDQELIQSDPISHITSSQECSIIQLVIPIVEFFSLSI